MGSGSWSRCGVQVTGTAAAVWTGLVTAAVLAVLLTLAVLAVLLTASICHASPGAISAPMSTHLESVASAIQIGLGGVVPTGGPMQTTKSRGAGSGLSAGPDPAPGTAERTAADRGDTSTTWLSEAAAADSLAAFWDDLDDGWLGATDPRMPNFGLDDATLDSLVTVSDQHLDKLARGDYTRFSFNPVGRMAFNRVQGPGFSNRIGLWDVKLDVPLVTRRRELPRGLGRGRPYRWLTLQLSAYRKARMFAGDGRKIRYLTSLVYGSDPNQYYDVVGAYARLIWRPARWLRVRGGIEQEEHWALAVSTDWNLIGRSLHPADNLPADPLRTQGVMAGLSFDAGWLDGSVDVRWNDLDYSSRANGRRPSGRPTSAITGRCAATRIWRYRETKGRGRRWMCGGDSICGGRCTCPGCAASGCRPSRFWTGAGPGPTRNRCWIPANRAGG